MDTWMDEDPDVPLGEASGSSGRVRLRKKQKTMARQEAPVLVDPDEVEELLTEYRKATAAHTGGDLAVPGWRVNPLGGGWLAKTHGLAPDYMHCAPRANSEEAKWGKRNGIGGRRRWSATYYGVEPAHILASTYGHKAQWFFNQWADRDELQLTEYEPYTEPAEFEALFDVLEDGPRKAAERIRAWWPTAPL